MTAEFVIHLVHPLRVRGSLLHGRSFVGQPGKPDHIQMAPCFDVLSVRPLGMLEAGHMLKVRLGLFLDTLACAGPGHRRPTTSRWFFSSVGRLQSTRSQMLEALVAIGRCAAIGHQRPHDQW